MVVQQSEPLVYRPLRAARRRWPWHPRLPEEILVVDGNVAVAVYDDDRAVGYGSLDALLKDHGLAPQQLFRAR